MKFGYFTLTDNPPAYGAQRRDPNQFLREVLEECQVAEELGYHSAWVPEHHFGFFGCLPAPATFLAYVAARTKRIQLAPATVFYRVTIRYVWRKTLPCLICSAMGGQCSRQGGDMINANTMRLRSPFEESRDRFAEGLDLLRTAWTKEEFTYTGRFYSITEPVTCLPRPVQKPHPPIYVACFSRPTVEMAAEQGFHTLFAPFAAAMMFGSVGAAVQTYHELAASHMATPMLEPNVPISPDVADNESG